MNSKRVISQVKYDKDFRFRILDYLTKNKCENFDGSAPHILDTILCTKVKFSSRKTNNESGCGIYIKKREINRLKNKIGTAEIKNHFPFIFRIKTDTTNFFI